MIIKREMIDVERMWKSIYIYIIAEAERNWIPTIKEMVTNRKKRPLYKLTHIQL